MSWNDDYTTDVNYPLYEYEMSLSPAFQSFCLLSQNILFDLPSGGNYLELGYGQGVSLNIHAATSDAHFWGTDYNPNHASFAQSLAQASGADLNLFDASFAELYKRSDLPQFETIVLYGVWSWVSEESRETIIKLLQKHLKPNGVVLVAYSTMPGWSVVAPVQHLMALHAKQAGEEAHLNSKINSALSFMEKLASTNTGYFADNHFVRILLDKLATSNRHYLAHDMFNANWHPMPFSEVVSRLSEAKLAFASSANPLDAIAHLNVTTEIEELLASIESPVFRESVRDCLLNQSFRRDIFMRGKHHLTPLEAREEKQKRCFVLLKSPDKVPMATRNARIRTPLQPSLYRPILAALAENSWKAKSIDWIEKQCAHLGIGTDEIWQAMIVLVGEQHVIPVNHKEPSQAVISRSRGLNTLLLKKTRSSNKINVLASPVAGAGIPVGHSEKLFLLAIREGAKTLDHIVDFAWRYIEPALSRPGAANAEGKVDAEKERVATLRAKAMVREEARTFMGSRLAILTALGID